MYHKLSFAIIPIFVASVISIQCIRSPNSTVSATDVPTCASNEKMESLRHFIRQFDKGGLSLATHDEHWRVIVETSTEVSSKGRIRISIQGVQDSKQGAEIYINFLPERKDFDIMVDWADMRQAEIFYLNSRTFDDTIEKPEFLEAVRLIITAANVSAKVSALGSDKGSAEIALLGQVAYLLMSWYPEERVVNLFHESLRKAYVMQGFLEKYVGENSTNETCSVTVARDGNGDIYSTILDLPGHNKGRIFLFNLISFRQNSNESCLIENKFTNTNSILDGKRKAQWTLGKSKFGGPTAFRTTMTSTTDADSKQTFKINTFEGHYSPLTTVGYAAKIEAKLCFNEGSIEKATIKRKLFGLVNVGIAVPIPLAGVSHFAKFSAECHNLKLVSRGPIFQ